MCPPPDKYLINLPPAEDTTSAASGFTVTPGFLRFVGETVFGNKWQTRLAQALGDARAKKLSPATVHQWITGRRSIPFWVGEALPDMIAREETHLTERVARTHKLRLRLQRSAQAATGPARRQGETNPAGGNA